MGFLGLLLALITGYPVEARMDLHDHVWTFVLDVLLCCHFVEKYMNRHNLHPPVCMSQRTCWAP